MFVNHRTKSSSFKSSERGLGGQSIGEGLGVLAKPTAVAVHPQHSQAGSAALLPAVHAVRSLRWDLLGPDVKSVCRFWGSGGGQEAPILCCLKGSLTTYPHSGGEDAHERVWGAEQCLSHLQNPRTCYAGKGTLQMWLSRGLRDGELILGEPGGPQGITRGLPRARQEGQSQQ